MSLFSTFITFLQKCKRTGINFGICTVQKYQNPKISFYVIFHDVNTSGVDYAEICVGDIPHYDRAGHIIVTSFKKIYDVIRDQSATSLQFKKGNISTSQKLSNRISPNFVQ